MTLDTFDEPSVCVHRLDGSITKFAKHASGLYVYDSAIRTKRQTIESVNVYTMVSTVAEQTKLFSRQQVATADLARELYRKIGRPGEAEFYSILTKNLICNCPVTPDDARRASHIYGPNVAATQGQDNAVRSATLRPHF